MILAELEVFHSRVYSPTRRIALGRRHLPTDPDFGPLLLGGIVAISAEELDPDLGPELERLLFQLDQGERVVQPRLRNRFQSDHHGLARTRAALVGQGEQLGFDLDGYGSPLQMTLAAAYAGGQMAPTARHRAFAMLRKAIRWRGEIGAELLAHLSGDERPPAWSAVAIVDPVRWAKEILGFDVDDDDRAARNGNGDAGDAGDARPSRRDVQRRYRQALRQAHPDHGGDTDDAAARIGDLAQARRILLG
ncbi:MAG: hypothetical protein ACRD0A_14220 [Acidimicrobiales bacterium]